MVCTHSINKYNHNNILHRSYYLLSNHKVNIIWHCFKMALSSIALLTHYVLTISISSIITEYTVLLYCAIHYR